MASPRFNVRNTHLERLSPPRRTIEDATPIGFRITDPLDLKRPDCLTSLRSDLTLSNGMTELDEADSPAEAFITDVRVTD